jgi:hypothetical protein
VTAVHVVAVVLVALAATAEEETPPGEPVAVRVELADGTVSRGPLQAIDAERVTLASEDGPQTWPVAEIRRVVCESTGRVAPPAAQVSLTDGGTLAGDDFTQQGEMAIIALPDGRIELPAERVQRVAWLAAGETAPAWRAAVPPRPTSDLVVVRREDGPEFVECAVAGVGPESVTVVLDGDTIPVKRAKVAGIEWLRGAVPPAGGTVVRVTGGRLESGSVAWSPAGLVLDDAIRLPAGLLRSIDYAAGRTVPLARLDPERVDVEPFFGSLGRIEGLAAFFRPRTVADPDGDGSATLVVRPRTVASWRIPAAARRLRATLDRDVPAGSPARVIVAITVDDREAFRRQLDATTTTAGPIAIDCDVRDGRRLTLSVDFAAGDLGCGVRLSAAAFEK